MTSVGVISSAMARIKCLEDLQKELESFPNEAVGLMGGLEGIKKSLVAAYGRKTEAEAEFVELEKEVVRLSYEIVDAIADASFKPSSIFSQWKKSGNTKLGDLQRKLNVYQSKLNPEQNPEASEIKEEKQQKPNKNLLPGKLTMPWNKHTANTEVMQQESKVEVQQKPNKSSSTSTSANTKAMTEESKEELQGENKEQNPKISEHNMVNLLIEDLLKPECSELYLVGKSGMGKTTLAAKLFSDVNIRKSFNVLAWVPINGDFKIKGVLQVLLQKLDHKLDTREMNEIELIASIYAQLDSKKYLIVLDNIDSVGDWESMRLALPMANSARAKVIITTSCDEFGKRVHSHQISGLSKHHIFRLLEEQTSFKRAGSQEVMNAIFNISGGSPLFATILGKSLQSEAATTSKKKLVDELDSYEPHRGTPSVLGACYKRLAPELKPCLLYMSQFPQGQDIEFDQLYLLLAAENLISSKEPKISPQSLRDNLDRLASLKLVEVQEDMAAASGHYKTCRLHEQVREFCKSKGSAEEFLEIVEFGSWTKVGEHARRLAVYLSKYKAGNSIQFDSRDTVKKMLSLLIFDTFDSAEGNSGWPSEISDLTELSHLRILNFDGVNFKIRKIPRGLDGLSLLRLLSFRGCFLEKLPTAVSNLKLLETLDLLVRDDCKMLIPSNALTNMKRMVNLYLPKLYHSNGKKKMELQHMGMLEILVNLDTEIFDVKALSHLKNLKMLSTISKGQSEDLKVVIDFFNKGLLQHSCVDITSFDYYDNGGASTLENLLRSQYVNSIHIEGRVGELPEEGACAEGVVAEIVLDGSELQLDPMAYLGKFQNLRSLVLSNDAFLGRQIAISAASAFPNLRSLKLQNLQFLESVTIQENATPKLSALKIDGHDCFHELSIPRELLERLRKVQGDNGEDAFSVRPYPKTLIDT